MNRPFYSLLLISMVLFIACSAGKGEGLSQVDNYQKVVLTFDLQDIVPNKLEKNIPAEDYIDRVSILIFDSATGENVYADHFQPKYAYQVRIKPGTYDLYFIANEQDLPLNILTRDDLDGRLHQKKLFEDYLGNSELPMARVYKSQNILPGGTVMNPQRFTPQLPSDGPLLPISSFGQDQAAAGKIKLIRAVAKVSVKLRGEGAAYLAKLEYVQASSEYSLSQLDENNLSQQIVDNIPFQKITPENHSNYAPLYIPERIFSQSEPSGWIRDATQDLDKPIGRVNFIQITTYGGVVYKIPIVANGHEATGDYLSFARDGTKADYNIVRNFEYQYVLTIPMKNRELHVQSVVQPWNIVDSEMSFTEAQINFEYPADQLTDETLLVYGQDAVDFTLKVMNSNGAIWRVALSNGLDFELIPNKLSDDIMPAIMGVGSDETTYGFTLRPLKPYRGTPRFTELYLLISGKEVSLFNDDTQVGPGKRFLIKQVRIN